MSFDARPLETFFRSFGNSFFCGQGKLKLRKKTHERGFGSAILDLEYSADHGR
jgi:hypothetical protein